MPGATRNEESRLVSQISPCATSFSNDGLLIVEQAFGTEFCETVAREVERVHRDFVELKKIFPKIHKMGEWSIRDPQLASETIHAFVFSQVFRLICARLIGPNADLYWTTTAAKPPLLGKSFPWHQDCGYGKGPLDYLTCWTALDSVDEQNGCLWVVPGSHKSEILPHEFRKSTENDYAGVFIRDFPLESPNAIPVCLRAGDLVCMHSRLIHRSTPNFSERKRRGIITAYVNPRDVELHRDEMEEETHPFLRERL